jgi:hypothetical protein
MASNIKTRKESGSAAFSTLPTKTYGSGAAPAGASLLYGAEGAPAAPRYLVLRFHEMVNKKLVKTPNA